MVTLFILNIKSLWSGNVKSLSESVNRNADAIFIWQDSDEVERFVARYMEEKMWNSDITFNRLCTHIRTRLPYTARTCADVKNWLEVTYKL